MTGLCEREERSTAPDVEPCPPLPSRCGDSAASIFNPLMKYSGASEGIAFPWCRPPPLQGFPSQGNLPGDEVMRLLGRPTASTLPVPPAPDTPRTALGR